MNWLEGIFLGFIQGFTEFLPISSSGHLVLATKWMQIETPGITFEVLANFASLIAILFYTRKDIFEITVQTLRHVRRPSDQTRISFKMALLVVIGSVPAAVLGFLFEDLINDKLHGVKTTAVMLIVTGIFLFFVRYMKGWKGPERIKKRDGWVIGLAQALALIPGVSRSGSTVVAGMFLGLKRETAIRYSFLLSIPVGFGTMLFKLDEVIGHSAVLEHGLAYGVMFVMTIAATWAGIKLFVGALLSHKLIYFALYCWIVGGLILLF